MAWIGLDLGGTKVYGVVLDGEKIVAEAKRKTPRQGGPLAVVDRMAAVVADLGGPGGVEGVGVGAPGAVDSRDGVVIKAPNLPGWLEPFPLATALSEALGGCPVAVDNDVNVGTTAEHKLGAARRASDFLGVFVGTGVGGALVLNRRLRRGPRGFAGEIGHVVIRADGRPCGCGGKGHVESYAGRSSMERRARSLDRRGRSTSLVELAGPKRMTSSVFARALAGKDPVALELVDEAVEALGIGIGTASTLLDVSLVVVGGGLADRLGPAFVGRIGEVARAQRFDTGGELRVVPAELGDQGGALGAALVGAELLARRR